MARQLRLPDCLTPEQLEQQQADISASIAASLTSQLEWALNQVWLDA